MLKQLTLALTFLVVAGGLQGCDQIGGEVEEPKDRPFGIYMGMPLEELAGSPLGETDNLAFWYELDEVPRPHALLSNYDVLINYSAFGTKSIGVCAVIAKVMTGPKDLNSVFDEELLLHEEKYGPYVLDSSVTQISPLGKDGWNIDRSKADWDFGSDPINKSELRFVEIRKLSSPKDDTPYTVELGYAFQNIEKCNSEMYEAH